MNIIKRGLILASALGALAIGGANNPVSTEKNTASTNIVLPSEDPYIVGFVEIPYQYSWKYFISSNNYLNSRVSRSHQASLQTKEKYLEDVVNFANTNEHPIKEIASVFENWYRIKEARAQAILDYIQGQFIWDDSMNVDEKPNQNYVKYPIETLVEKCGNCEDLAILGAALMKEAGLDVALLYMPKIPHVAIGVAGRFEGTYYEAEGKMYFYAEASNNGLPAIKTFKIGEVPEKFGNPEAFIRVIKENNN